MADSGTGTLLLPFGRKVKLYQKPLCFSGQKLTVTILKISFWTCCIPMVYRKRTFPMFPAVRNCYSSGHGKWEWDTLHFLKVSMHLFNKRKNIWLNSRSGKRHYIKENFFSFWFLSVFVFGFFSQSIFLKCICFKGRKRFEVDTRNHWKEKH